MIHVLVDTEYCIDEFTDFGHNYHLSVAFQYGLSPTWPRNLAVKRGDGMFGCLDETSSGRVHSLLVENHCISNFQCW